MQFRNPKTKNFLKLKKISRSKRCQICHNRMRNTGVFVYSKQRKDATAIKCINCLTIYNTEFQLTHLGIPRQVAYS